MVPSLFYMHLPIEYKKHCTHHTTQVGSSNKPSNQVNSPQVDALKHKDGVDVEKKLVVSSLFV
jgi:hypothetical protein